MTEKQSRVVQNPHRYHTTVTDRKLHLGALVENGVAFSIVNIYVTGACDCDSIFPRTVKSMNPSCIVRAYVTKSKISYLVTAGK